MTQNNNFAADYIPVNERIQAFHAKYPDGSLQSDILTLNDKEVLIRAQAFRHPDDPRPGIGHARETIPGSTPYTRGSEVENAETSAWGRAIAALGFEVKAGIATAEDVRNAQARENAPQRPRPVAPPQQPAPQRSEPPRAATAPVQGLQPMTMREAMEALEGIDKRAISDAGKALFGTWSLKEMTPEQRAQLVAHLRGGEGPVPAAPPPPPSGDDEDWGGLLDQAPAA
jgi:hypothetical protein